VAEPEPHPVVAVLALRRISRAALAKATGYRRTYLTTVLHGNLPASPALRRKVAEALGLPESELFHPRPERSLFPGDRTLKLPGDRTLKQVVSQ
jgi:transcriptional regulator with XRE-family HTH domain